jgi:NAD(P)H dehydrogenase (quinone)
LADRDEVAMILVTGAAGKTGMAIIKALAARGAAARGLVHRSDRSAELAARGAREVAAGAFDDGAALVAAASGTQAIYHICPNVSPHEVAYARAVIAAAKAAGIPRFVYHSVLHPQIEAMPHHWAKLRAEELVLASGLDVTILQPTAYMQNILAGWRSIIEDGVYRVPYPVGTRISLVDLRDVAEAAALVLTEDGHAGATYELVGTPALSQSEVAEALSLAVGRPVGAVAETVEARESRARAASMSDYQRETLAAMFRSYAADPLVGNANVLTWLLGRRPTTLVEFAADASRGGIQL